MQWQESEHLKVSGYHVESIRFNGGEIGVRLRARLPVPEEAFSVTAILKNADAIMELLLVCDALKRKELQLNDYTLIVPYFPYARQDRVCNEGESLSARVMCDLINSLGFHEVIIFDAHSDVVPALLNNCINIPQYDLFDLSEFDLKVDTVVSPDAGAEKKARAFANAISKTARLVCATKRRNTATGEIVRTDVPYDLRGENCLIIDDICDGGRTFIELAKALKEKGAGKIYLYVTHGIFSQGIDVFQGLIDTVFYTNSLLQNKNESAYFINQKEF
jgi:ribose-phosphate pyrophosphokinase